MMRRRSWVILLLCLLTVSPLLSQLSSAAVALRVNEAETRILLEDDQARVSLAVENPTGSSFPARVRLEVLDPQGKAVATVESDETIRGGKFSLVAPLPLSPRDMSDDEALWYRLRYRITPLLPAGETGTNGAEGILSLSEITPDIFQLRVVAPEPARAGTRYRAQIFTTHPVTARPVKGVRVEAKFYFDSDDLKGSKLATVTDADGHAEVVFDLPPKIGDEEHFHLEVAARRGPLVQEAEESVDFDRAPQIFVSTDKPLYQPGQVLHARALLFDSLKHAEVGRDATLKITDPEGKTVFEAELKSSRFGVVSADWAIPEDIRLGDYRLKVGAEDGDDDGESEAEVKISRYEVPNFAVQVKPDLPYYLPGQNANVAVRADYLFGQPVKRGRVRVVREASRRWDYRGQKWEVDEEEKYEGETDERGVFLAQVDLSKEHAELQSEDYSRYRDLSYAAYFTDPTTNRTEQRRFDLRLTKSAIHVYVIEGGERQARGFPMKFYLSTYYADGSPAACDVTIMGTMVDAGRAAFYEQPLRTVHTNSLGVAKIDGLALPDQARGDSDAALTFLAHDRHGATGRQSNAFWYSGRPVLRLDTDKTFYREGEPVRVSLAASQPEMKAIVDVWLGQNVVQSHVVRLRGGRASLLIPYDKAFKGTALRLTAYAYGPTAEISYDMAAAARRVVYPGDDGLKLDVRLDRATYKPGEEARADFRVRAADGRAVESALGVVVFDKAVEERARTDNEFGAGHGFAEAYRSLTGDEAEFLKLDLSGPIPEGTELAAEIALNGQEFRPHIFGSGNYPIEQREVFSDLIARQVRPTQQALAARYSAAAAYPRDEASLRRLLADAGLDLESQRDPWGTPFRASFNVEREQDVMTIASAGADKRFDTEDDFTAARMSWPYFRPQGEIVDRAVEQFHKRTGDHVRDARNFESELRSAGLDFTSLRDRWGNPYRVEFGTSGYNFTVAVKSGGPDGKFASPQVESDDDFTIWTSYSDYFAERRAEIGSSLADYLKRTGLFPQNETELRAALAKSGVHLDQFQDLWGHDYYVAFANDPRRAAPFRIQTHKTYEEAARKEVSPLTQPLNLISVRSPGADGARGTADDFDVASLSRYDVELIAKGGQSPQAMTTVVLTGASGAITGTITDPQDAVVAGASVTATNESDNSTFTVQTDDEGRFVLGNLFPGYYTLKAESPGFQVYVVEHVPVRSSNVTRLDAMLNVAGATETVTITSSPQAMINATSATVASSVRVNYLRPDGASVGREQAATPRLREYFPETLVWRPLMETDTSGRARLAFKLADNITTWKMAVLSSTEDGEVGLVEKEIRAFQPFFVEHDPPRVLTEGDEIELGIVLRNYLDKPQAVDLEMQPESWFALIGPSRKRAEVASNDSSRETFGFRAVASIREGRQRITAAGGDAADAIEKPVSVHPDGEERAAMASRMLGEATTLSLDIPPETIKTSLRAQVKIYPNLMSHVSESVEGILERPHGCGEQTISSTYPNLMILRFARASGVESAVAARAREYLLEGYKRLLNYRTDSGGFSYWGRDDSPDLALTAYALKFLTDARGYVELDESVLDGARDFLVRQQLADGSWANVPRYAPPTNAPRGDLTLTSYVALAIAGAEQKGAQKAGKVSAVAQSASALSLKRALAYLARNADGEDDAYMLASYAQVAAATGEKSQAARAVSKLRALAQTGEDGTIFWKTEHPTPFHGWGTAGRLETTALALQALTDSGDQQLIAAALFYLLRQKDRHGVWLSTQATVNVLNALIAVFSTQEAARPTFSGGEAEVIVNGRAAATVKIPPGRLNNPVSVDISQFVAPGANEVLIRRDGSQPLASAQVVSTFYVPWAANRTAHAASDPVRLNVNFDKTQAAIGEEITCRVEAAARNGGGMLLAEIGLPPGADVDRATLELATKDFSINRYDVLPDRVTVYLWPRTGGTTFEFKFRPRFGLNAQSAPSLIYDYYNPEARMVVAPTRFTVR